MLSWAIGEFTANIHLKSKIPQTHQPTCGKVLCRSPVSGALEEDRPNINASSVKRAHSNVFANFPPSSNNPCTSRPTTNDYPARSPRTRKRTGFAATAKQQPAENSDNAPASARFTGATRQHPGFQQQQPRSCATSELPDNVILLFQPPACPSVNPTERVWEYLKDFLAWSVFSNLDELRIKVQGILASFTARVIGFLTGWSWILHSLSLSHL